MEIYRGSGLEPNKSRRILAEYKSGLDMHTSYQKVFGVTENFDLNYHYFVTEIESCRKLPFFLLPLFCSPTTSFFWR